MKFWHTLEHGWTLKTLCWVTYWIRSDQISHSVMSDWIVKWKSLSCVWLLATPWTVAHQAPLSMEILQARILEWAVILFFRGSSWPRDQTWVSYVADGFFTIWPTREIPTQIEFMFFGRKRHCCQGIAGSVFLLTQGLQSEKAMAPHFSPLAWKIPWAEEPSRLQSMGSLRVGHDWATSPSLFTFMHWRRQWQLIPVFLLGECQGWGSLVGCCLWGSTELDTTEAT